MSKVVGRVRVTRQAAGSMLLEESASSECECPHPITPHRVSLCSRALGKFVARRHGDDSKEHRDRLRSVRTAVPFIPGAGAGAIALTLWIIPWARGASRQARNGCSRCGYDLTGNVSGLCPECGAPIATGIANGRAAASWNRTDTSPCHPRSGPGKHLAAHGSAVYHGAITDAWKTA